MTKVYVTRMMSDHKTAADDRISVRILILYSDNTYEFVDLDGGWYRKPNDEKTDLSRGYECKDFIKFLNYQKCRNNKWTKEKTMAYLKQKEEEFQKDESKVHAIWTREESHKRWSGGIFFMPRINDGDKPEYHFKSDALNKYKKEWERLET